VIDPRSLYVLKDSLAEVPLGLPVLAGLNGFSDAGGTIAQVADNIFANFDSHLVAQFVNDELLDYRSRRPIMYFERDHIESYEPAVLGLYLVFDEANQPFLYLHGYEPDFKWDSFVAAVKQLFDLFAVSSVTWVHSIPFPTPHTRPIGITVSGNRREFIDSVSEWKPSTQVPGNVLHLLEYELTQAGLPIIGFVMLVPHYLSDSEYPQAAIIAFEQISAATGLVFRTDPLREENSRFVTKLNHQVEENADLQRMIQNLEQGYAKSENAPGSTQLVKPEKKVPSADEIAAELEDYLASRSRNSADDEETGN
jgi:hypothetical protein